MKVRLFVGGVSSASHPRLRAFVPDDPEVFDEVIEVEIGDRASKKAGRDCFTIRVATPAALANAEEQRGIVAEGPLLVMKRFDFDQLFEWLERTVEKCRADSWQASVWQLQRHFHWEFDFMQSEQ